MKKDRRHAIAPTLGFGLPLGFSKGFDGAWPSVVEATQRGNIMEAAQSAILALTGIAVGMPGTHYEGPPVIEMHKILNPTDFTAAGAIKGLIIGSVVSKIVGTKLGVNRAMKKIPFVGKYIKL